MIIIINFIIALSNFTIAQLLILKGASVNAENNQGKTPLFKGSLSLFYLFSIICWFTNIYFHLSIVLVFFLLGWTVSVVDWERCKCKSCYKRWSNMFIWRQLIKEFYLIYPWNYRTTLSCYKYWKSKNTSWCRRWNKCCRQMGRHSIA